MTRFTILVDIRGEVEGEVEGEGEVHLVLFDVLYTIAFIVGTIGNSLVILAVLLSKKLRTTTNAFVVNLSVANVLTCFVIPVNASYVSELLLKICGKLAKGADYILLTTLGCSICTLMCIALNRWLLITRPLTTYRNVYTPKKTALWLVFTWVIPLVFVLTSDLVVPMTLDTTNVVIAVVMFPIPLILIIVCYILIWRRINRQVRSMASSSPTLEVSNEPIHNSTTETQLDDILRDSTQPQASSSSVMTTGDQLSHHQTQITKNMFYIVCAFVLCVGPRAVCFFLDSNELSKLVAKYAFAVLVFNGCINPLIYATKHRDFKTVFRCIVRRQWDNIPEPSNFLKAVKRSKCCCQSNPV
ncbi:G-protein coupled receptor 84-like [Patiria miniata]|uniref:G-protein coupled receptors family 1 profile domain-containing protein n=1 Tax=Patiria miniata TaxID=46514 RepID=A0A913Z773_PATMI|nr:G-protein coupled receptor 84-like [Patiria miniata]